jgi:hypothetical protein
VVKKKNGGRLMNKKILILAVLGIPAVTYTYSECDGSNFDLAFSSGFVWKNDDLFKCVYGSGIVNAITVDGCYYPCTYGGVGLKTAYWGKKGETTILKQCTKLREVPLIAYLKARIGTWLQGYISLGGGVIFVREKSYLGCASTATGIGEAEVGINCHILHSFYITVAANALFPSTKINGHKAIVGGYGLRAGIGFSF